MHNSESCLKYEVKLVIRPGKHGPFLECSQYPACDYTRPLKSSVDGHAAKIPERQVCPACGANLVLHQGRFGMFISCGNYPEYGHIELIDEPGEIAITCPQCRTGHLVQRRSYYGKTFHSCDRYPEYQSAINFRPVARKCPKCHYPLLIEKKAAQGVKHFCASKRCEKPISVE